MSALFAYHRTYMDRPFWHTYYITKKKNPRIGDNIFIISGDRPKSPQYFLEGLYVVYSIEPYNSSGEKLLLKKLLGGVSPPCINDEEWFNNEEFHNIFTRGQSMNPVPIQYEARFRKILQNYDPPVGIDSAFDGDAINDLGSDHTEKDLHSTATYPRDPRVRQAVMRRANGKCEYCGEPGFICIDRTRYLESHHIRALADDGADRMNNVIALCPKDHRQAHFSANRDEIEKKMTEIVGKLEGGMPVGRSLMPASPTTKPADRA